MTRKEEIKAEYLNNVATHLSMQLSAWITGMLAVLAMFVALIIGVISADRTFCWKVFGTISLLLIYIIGFIISWIFYIGPLNKKYEETMKKVNHLYTHLTKD